VTVHRDVINNIERAPAGPEVAALFDFDGTLIAGFSATAFLREQLRRGDISTQEFLEVVGAAAQFSLGNLGFSALMSTTARFMRGIPEEEFVALGQQIYERQIARRVYPESRALVHAHQARGHTVAIISSATPYQVEPVARELGIANVICSRLEVENGLFTGRAIEPLCFGQGKVDAAEDLALRFGVDLDRSFFYSDSADDIELLRHVGYPQPLNPNARLTEIAEREGWPVRRFRSRGQAGAIDYLRSLAATASVLPSALAGLPIWALTGSQREARNFSTSLFADLSSALIGLRLVVRGEQHLWSQRPAVFVFNHQSKADLVILPRLLRRDFAGVAKQELRNTPLFGKTLEWAGTVFVDRENPDRAIASMRPLVDAMKRGGKSVVIAPEGTRTVSPQLAPFKKGAFHLAIAAGVPMVPIVIHNAGDVAPKGDFVFRPATVEVDVLPPIDTSDWRVETIDRHVAEVRALFEQTLGQAEEPAAPPAASASKSPATGGKKVLKKKTRRSRKVTRPAAKEVAKSGRKARKKPRPRPLRKKVLPGKAAAEGER